MGKNTKLSLVASGAGSHEDKGHSQEHLEEGKGKDGRKTMGTTDYFLHWLWRPKHETWHWTSANWKDPWQAKHPLTLLLPISLPLEIPAQGAQISHNHNSHKMGMGDEDTPLF